jgi:thymidylate synthase
VRHIDSPGLGQAWLALLLELCREGEPVADETLELRGISIEFDQASASDPLLLRFAERGHIEEMRKVFFSSEPNGFGHSYRERMRGPEGRNDLLDVIGLLRREPATKRAVLTLVGDSNKVPCINVVHFMCRDGRLEASYFARGQDIYRKFYADALCIHEMAERVAEPLAMNLGPVSGFISSAHIYTTDLPRIRALLAEAKQPAWTELQMSGGSI